MSANQSVYYAVEAKVPGRAEEWSRYPQRYSAVESARELVNLLRKMAWEMRILKIVGSEEVVEANA